MSQLLSLSVSYSSHSLALNPLFLIDQAEASCCVFFLCPFIMKYPLLPHLPRPQSSPTCASLSLQLCKSRVILFISFLRQAFSIPPPSSFSPALLAVCSKYTEPPPESWREVRMGWNRKERASTEERDGEKRRGRKQVYILVSSPDFQTSSPNAPSLFPLMSSHNRCHCRTLLRGAESSFFFRLAVIMSFVTKCRNLLFTTSDPQQLPVWFLW